VDDRHLAKWKARLADASRLKIGLVWAGHPSHVRDRERSISLKSLKSLFRIDGVRLFSLQKGPASAEIEAFTECIQDLSTELVDFSDTAAAIQQLDLVISVDTAVAHLAGALARPVWLLLPGGCDFRWMEGRSDSPWYPTMRLFRQACRGDWTAVVRDLDAALRERGAGPCLPSVFEQPDSNGTTSNSRRLAAVLENDRQPCSAVAETCAGIIHYLREDHVIAESIRCYGEYLQPALDEILRLLPRGAAIVEVAANCGIHALAMAAAIGSTGHVLVYEGRTLHRRLLHQNIVANKASNITFMRRSVKCSSIDSGSETIDQLALERLELLKINAPALYSGVIEGAADTIWRLRPLLALTGVDPRDLAVPVQSMRDFGYRCWRMDRSHFNPNNFYGCKEDVHRGQIATTLFGIAEEKEVDMSSRGLHAI
jgi:hypothetical protein